MTPSHVRTIYLDYHASTPVDPGSLTPCGRSLRKPPIGLVGHSVGSMIAAEAASARQTN